MTNTLTLRQLWKESPENNGEHQRLCRHFGLDDISGRESDATFPASEILKVLNLKDALWMIERRIDVEICKAFTIDCAEQALHIYEGSHPEDTDVREALEVAKSTFKNPDQDPDRIHEVYWDMLFLAQEPRKNSNVTSSIRAVLAAVKIIGDKGTPWGFAISGSQHAAAALWALDRPRSDTTNHHVKRLGQYLDFGLDAQNMPWPDMPLAEIDIEIDHEDEDPDTPEQIF